MVQLLHRLKILRRFGFSLFSSAFASRPSSHFTPLQKHRLLCSHFTSEVLANQQQEDNFTTVNYLIKSCGLSPNVAISASKRVELKSPERADSVLALLKNHGLSETQISKMVSTRPSLLSADPEKTLLPKLEFFSSTVGVSREILAKTLAYNPVLLQISLEKRIVPTYEFLRSMLSEQNVISVFRSGSWIFANGHSKSVAPNIGILKELGMPHSYISLLLAHHPYALTRNPVKFVQVVDEVKKMGFDLEISTSVEAIQALCSSNSKSIWNRSRQVYMSYGWSEDDVVYAFKKNPRCMIMSDEKLTQALEFLVNKMGWPSGVIAKNPKVLSYSLEKRIIPRCSVVKVLLHKGLIGEIENLSLGSVLVPMEKYFLERFVARYKDEAPQLLSLYQGKLGVQDV